MSKEDFEATFDAFLKTVSVRTIEMYSTIWQNHTPPPLPPKPPPLQLQ